MENKMKEVAELLGIKLEEEFIIEGFSNRYKFSKDGLMYLSDTLGKWNPSSSKFNMLLTGEAQIIKLPKSILDKEEKEYLSSVIKPFRNRILYIRKIITPRSEFIEMSLKHYDDKKGNISFMLPPFKKGTMYKGMEPENKYTLKELKI